MRRLYDRVYWFFQIVWRLHPIEGRIGIALAWEVAGILA